MKKILIVSTVSRQFYLFEKGNIEVLKELGYEIYAAANYSDENERLNELEIIRKPFEIQRSPFSLKNIKAYRQLKEIMKSENFDIVHCHSPMGGVLARLAAKAIGKPKIIYTAHGFHFYDGAPLLNWVLYYPIEKFLAHYTNIIITINQEDYMRAMKFKTSNISYIPGIGVDSFVLSDGNIKKSEKLKDIGVPENAFVLLSVGELNANKNHAAVIKAISMVSDSSIYYLICGKGEKEESLKKLAKRLGVLDKVIFLGFRDDVKDFYLVSDVFIFPSFREGLSVSLMEAMSYGLPIICSNIRGNKDLVKHQENGYLVDPNDSISISKYIIKLQENVVIRKEFSIKAKEFVLKFDKENVKVKMKYIYNSFLHKNI